MMAAQSIADIDLWQIVQAYRERILELERQEVPFHQPIQQKPSTFLRPHERETLQAWVAAKSMFPAMKRRARIILLADEGLPNAVIATRLRMSRPTVRHWRARFARRGLAGLEPLPKPGRPAAKDRAIRALPAAIETTAAEVAKQRERQQSSRADPHRKPRPRTASLAALAKLLPPGRPACFDTDAIWQDFIQHAAVSGRRDHADGPVIWIQGSPALNRDFSYCEDCTAARQARMQGENRCLPHFLKGSET